jgi:hypothetical protein
MILGSPWPSGWDISLIPRGLSPPGCVGSNPARTDMNEWESLSVYLREDGGLSPNTLHSVSGFSLPPINLKTDRHHITENFLTMAKNYKQSSLQNHLSKNVTTRGVAVHSFLNSCWIHQTWFNVYRFLYSKRHKFEMRIWYSIRFIPEGMYFFFFLFIPKWIYYFAMNRVLKIPLTSLKSDILFSLPSKRWMKSSN